MTPVLLFSLHYQIKLYSPPNHFQPTLLEVQSLHTLLWASPLLGDGNASNLQRAHPIPQANVTLVVSPYQEWNTDVSLRVIPELLNPELIK